MEVIVEFSLFIAAGDKCVCCCCCSDSSFEEFPIFCRLLLNFLCILRLINAIQLLLALFSLSSMAG